MVIIPVSYLVLKGHENGKSTSKFWHETSISCPLRGPRRNEPPWYGALLDRIFTWFSIEIETLSRSVCNNCIPLSS